MKLKDLYNSTKVIKSSSLEDISADVESERFIDQISEDERRFYPNVDFSDPSQFAIYGSAEKYYSDAFLRIRTLYPYDGSEAEKTKWINESTFIDKYIFDHKYPRFNGYVNLGYPSWGTLSGTLIDGYGKSTTNTYIKTFGGPNKSDLTGLGNQFGDANKLDTEESRESNLKFNLNEGVTIEMWVKKPAFDTSKTEKEVLFDLWNGEASSSAQYGRLRLELTGASSGSPFLFTAMSGTSGSQYQSFGQNVTTASITDWTHIALSLKNTGSDVSANFYLNGALNHEQTISSTAIGNVTGSLISFIGALQTAPSGSPTVQTGAGKFSGSIDEFRYWKTERTSKEIGRNYWNTVGGGSNSDKANTKLGVYYKFNEGITQTSSYDSVVLDYSGRVSNGAWTGYQSGARSTDSAMVLAGVLNQEFKDPTIRSAHPEYVSTLSELESSGSHYDTYNNSSIFHTMPQWILEEDDLKGGNLRNLTQIIASHFDNMHIHIKEVGSLKDIYSHFQTKVNDEYSNTSTSGSVKPLPFADRLLTNFNFVAPELFSDATVLEKLAQRSEDENYEMKINDVKNQIYQNVYSGLVNTFKEKGTNKSFRNILHAFGIDEEVVKINFYGNNVEFELKDRFSVRSIKEKFVDFNHPDRFNGSIYQISSGSNPSYVTGSNSEFEKFIPLTFETQVILPNKLPWNEQYSFNTPFTKSVIAGMSEATSNSDYTVPSPDNCDIQIYAERDQVESKRVTFHLSSSALGVHMSSSLYEEMYDNNEWLFAFKLINDKYPNANMVSSSDDGDYKLHFIGYNTVDSTELNSFELTSSVSSSEAQAFLTKSKRIYAGAKRTNFTGSLSEKTDVKIGFVRLWYSDLSNDTLKRHSYDSRNYGAESPFRSAYLSQTEANSPKVPEIDTLILNWDFSTLSKTDSNGEAIILDASSGSAEVKYNADFEAVKNNFYFGKLDFMEANDEKAIDVEYITAARSTYPEILQGDDMIEIRTQDDIKFTKETLPQEFYIAFEKSMAQTVSQEMINFMSSVTDFNNLIGRPVERYRTEYKSLAKLRQLFFERVSNEPDLDKYIDYYKWLDDALGEMLVALVPASLNHSDGVNNVVENYVFSRDKYTNKFPTIEFKPPSLEAGMNTINRHLYPWKTGHAPVGGTPENESCYWWLERAERDQSPLSSSDSGSNNSRVKVFQARNSVLNRSYSTPQHFAVDRSRAIHGGTNYEDNKKRDYIWSATKEVSESPLTYGEFGGFPLRYVLANNDMFQSLKDCNDERPVAEKIKRAFSAVDGFMAFHHDMSGGHDGIFKGGMVMPFNIMSSSVTTGYSAEVNGIPGVEENVNVVNVHSDTTDNTNEIPMQSPFTERWVGGHQHRHAPINDGGDTEATRGEGYKILINNIENASGSIGIVGADYPYPYANQEDAPFFRIDQAKARYYREERAKRPLNIKNIQTSGTTVGNYQKTYQFVHTFGRGINKTRFRDIGDSNLHNSINSSMPATNLEASLVSRGVGGNGNLASNFNSSSLYLGGVKDTTENSVAGTGKSVIANRFSAPGGFETMSEVFLDMFGKEKSAYNALPFRNLQVRGSGSGESGTIRLFDIHGNRYGLATHLTRHASQFGIDSVLGGNNPAFHKINRNPKWNASKEAKSYDNYWVQHQVPQSDFQYRWVKSSHTSSLATSSLAGHLLSDITEPSGTTSTYPYENVDYTVVSQSVLDQRITGATVYGFPSWEQIRNNDVNKNVELKKGYGYGIENNGVSGVLEESRITANIPNYTTMKFKGETFRFIYPYVNMKYHFDNNDFSERGVNIQDNETIYDNILGYYQNEEHESFGLERIVIRQNLYPEFKKHTKYDVRHRHYFVSKFWTDGENLLYNTDTGPESYSNLDEVGRRKVNVTASLFSLESLNSQTKDLVTSGVLTNIIPSQSIWNMDSRTNFMSSNPQTAASNSAGAPGVLQNQDHHFHNGLDTIQTVIAGTNATGSFEVSGAIIPAVAASSSFTVSGLPVGGERSYLQFDASYQMAEDGYAIYVNSGSIKGVEVDYLLPSVVTGTNLSVSPVTYRKALAITGSDYLSGAVEYSNGGQNFVLSAYLRIPTGSLTFDSEKYIYKVMSGSQIVASLFYNSGATTADQYDLYFRHYAEDDQGEVFFKETIFEGVGGSDNWRQYTLFSNQQEAELFIDNVAHASETIDIKITGSNTSNSPVFYSPTIHYIMGDNNNSEWRDQVEISDMILWDVCPAQNTVNEVAFADAIWNSGVFSPDTTHSGSDIQFRYTFGDDSGDGTRAGDNIVDVAQTFDLTIPHNLTSDFVDSKFATMKTSTQYFDQITSSLESLTAFDNYFSVYYVEYTETASSGYSTKWYHTTSFDVQPQDSTHLPTQHINSGDNLNYARFFVIAKQESSNSNYDLNPSASNGTITIDQEKGFRNLDSINSGSAQVNALDSIEDTGITIDGTAISFNHHNNSQSGNKVNTFSSTFERCISGSVTPDQVKLENSPYSNGLVSGDDISVSYWHQKAPSGTEGIVFLDSTTGSPTLGALFVYHTSTTMYIRIYSGTGTTDYKVWQVTYASVGINNNDLNHFCWTIDVSNVSSDSAVTLYVNGTAVTLTATTDAGFSGTFSHTYNRLQVIGTDGSSAYELVGKLCQVSIWDTVLTADDASEIYNDGRVKDLYRHRKVNRLVHWYKLGQESNLTALSIGDNLSTITTIEDSTPRGYKSDLTVSFGSTMTVENGLPDNVVSDSTFWSNLNTSIDSNVSDYNADNTGGSFTITSTTAGSSANSDTHSEDSPLITSLVSPSAGGVDAAGSVDGHRITIDGTSFTLTSSSPSSQEVLIDGVTNSQVWDALLAEIDASSSFNVISTSSIGNVATFNLESNATGTSENGLLTNSGNSFNIVTDSEGGTDPVTLAINFIEIIPQPRFNYPHALVSPGSLRAPTAKSNLGLINADYKLRSNHFNLTRSLGHSTDGLYDNTSRWQTPDLSGLTPFDSDYDTWYENIRGHNKHFSLVPEFRISSHVKDIVSSGSSEVDYFKNNFYLEITGTSLDSGSTVARNTIDISGNQFLKEYSISSEIKNMENFINDNSGKTEIARISLTCDAIMSFLPYEGFYPQSRTVQMCEAFANSYAKHFVAEEADPDNSDLDFPDNNVFAQTRPIFDAVMSPGLLFNTIKSGMAVDYPIITSKLATASLTDPYGGTNYMINNEYFDDRLPFETLINPESYLKDKKIVDANPHISSSFNLRTRWNGLGDINYRLMSNNFFAESIEFFLEGGKTSRIISKPDTDPNFGIVIANHAGQLPVYRSIFKVYKSKKQHPWIEFKGATEAIKISGSNNVDENKKDKYFYRPPSGTNYFLDEFEDLSGSNLEYDIEKISYPRPQMNPYAEVETITMYSQPNSFGPPCAGGVTVEFGSVNGSTPEGTGENNTTYMMYDSTNGYNAPFTPPYYDGEAWAIYTFTPQKAGKHTLDEILENTTVEFLRYELNHESGSYGDRGTSGPQGFSINENAMQIDASFNLFKQVSAYRAAYSSPGVISEVDTNPEFAGKAWVIESKYETPILDFSKYLNREYNAEFESDVSVGDIYTSKLSLSGTRQEPDVLSSLHSSLSSVHELSGILNPIGMWHQYGEFPNSDDKGIFMQMIDVPSDYTLLGTEMTIANPKYAVVKPDLDDCDASSLDSVYNLNPSKNLKPYFKQQETRRKLIGNDEASVLGGSIQILNKQDGIILDTELKLSDIELIYGSIENAKSSSGLFTVFSSSSYTKAALTTSSSFTGGLYQVFVNTTASSASYPQESSGNYQGHWATAYYNYDRADSYTPLLVEAKDYNSLSFDFGQFPRGIFEDFLKEFSIGVKYTDQSADMSDKADVQCVALDGDNLIVPSNIQDKLSVDVPSITSLAKVDMSEKERRDILGLSDNDTKRSGDKFKLLRSNRISKKFNLIPDNPSVESAPASAVTAAYSNYEPTFARASIRYNAGGATGLSFSEKPQMAPQNDKNFAGNASTVRWGQFMHNEGSTSLTQSLAQLVGFSQEKVKMGVTAATKKIREAVIAIPYIADEDEQRDFLSLNKREIDKYLFDNGLINKDRNLKNIDGSMGLTGKIGDSVISQIEKMARYNIPPHLDFVTYDTQPVPMYIFEFEKELEREDLNAIWQGVRTENLKKVEFKNKVVTHDFKVSELLGDDEAIKDVKWIVFKVKQKASINYEKKMSDDLIDGRYAPDQENLKDDLLGVKFGYNWPYDFFSMVENVKMSVDVHMTPIEESQLTVDGTVLAAGYKTSTPDTEDPDPNFTFEPVFTNEPVMVDKEVADNFKSYPFVPSKGDE